MTDRDLCQLVYVSRNRIPSGDPAAFEREVANILKAARQRNPTIGVTGALLFTGDGFAQYLEGARAAVAEIYETISLDARHADLVILDFGVIERRTFAAFAMARVGPLPERHREVVAGREGGIRAREAIDGLVAAMKAHAGDA